MDDWMLEREYLLRHLRHLESNWMHSERVDERQSARHFQTIADELESGDMLKNAKLLKHIRESRTTEVRLMNIDWSEKRYWTVALLQETLPAYTVLESKEVGDFEKLWQAKLDCERVLGSVIRPK